MFQIQPGQTLTLRFAVDRINITDPATVAVAVPQGSGLSVTYRNNGVLNNTFVEADITAGQAVGTYSLQVTATAGTTSALPLAVQLQVQPAQGTTDNRTLIGQSLQMAQGTANRTATASRVVSGISLQVAQGTVTRTIGTTSRSVTGQQIRFLAGTPTTSAAGSRSLTSQQVRIVQGTASYPDPALAPYLAGLSAVSATQLSGEVAGLPAFLAALTAAGVRQSIVFLGINGSSNLEGAKLPTIWPGGDYQDGGLAGSAVMANGGLFTAANYNTATGLTSQEQFTSQWTGRSLKTGLTPASLGTAFTLVQVLTSAGGASQSSGVSLGSNVGSAGRGFQFFGNNQVFNGIAGGPFRLISRGNARGIVAYSQSAATSGSGRLYWEGRLNSIGSGFSFNGTAIHRCQQLNGSISLEIIANRAWTDAEHLAVAAAIRAFETARGRASAPYLPQYFFAGDSLQAGFTDLSANYTPQPPTMAISFLSTATPVYAATTAESSNLAVSGDTIAQVRARIDTILAGYYESTRARNVLFFWAGTNDCAFEAAGSAATIKGRIDSAVDYYRGLGYTVFIGNFWPSTSYAGYTAQQQANFNSNAPAVNTLLADDTARYANRLVDMATLRSSLTLPDTLHPNTADVNLIAQAIKNLIVAQGFGP